MESIDNLKIEFVCQLNVECKGNIYIKYFDELNMKNNVLFVCDP